MAEQEKKDNQRRRKRIGSYAEKVRKEFAKAVNDILDYINQPPELKEDEFFEFEGKKRLNYKVEQRLRTLHSAVYTAIEGGIKLEWNEAIKDIDKIITKEYGEQLADSLMQATMAGNADAMKAFIERSVGGMGLSDAVWRDVKQFKQEMEAAITMSVGAGESASTMSRKVRQYLNEPDKLFRRVRNEKGELVPSKAMKQYHPGRGVYRSSAKNAMRVARTETNMAYRASDHERMQKMDFVRGVEVHISNRHKHEGMNDICDCLAGKYPKEFKFVGWHPQCLCYVTTVLASRKEIVEMLKARRNGEPYEWKTDNIDDVPEGMKTWMEQNEKRIKTASKNGKLPYFIKDNFIDGKVCRPRFKAPTKAEELEKQKEEIKKNPIKTVETTTPELSKNMPDALKPGSKYLRGEEYYFSKQFFDLIDPNNCKLNIQSKDRSSCFYSPSKKEINLIDGGGARGAKSSWQLKKVVYHEYGHCIDDQRGLAMSAEVQELRAKHKGIINRKMDAYVERLVVVRDEVKGLYTEKRKVKQSVLYARIVDERLQRLKEKIKRIDDVFFTKRGITKDDVLEQILSTRDTIMSLNYQYGVGHAKSYMKNKELATNEYLAHSFENTYIGNRIFEKYLPEIYKDTIDFINSLKPLE